MPSWIRLAVLAAAFSAAPFALAQAPAAKPANATGQCKDGTYSTAASKSGACGGHHGVKEWYTASAPAAPKSAAAAPAPAAPAPTKTAPLAPAPSSAQAAPNPTPSAKTARGPKASLSTTAAAPGGGPGLVWVNTASNVYHCPGTDFYGKTKAGSYMSEADAKAKGGRPDHGKACGH